MRTWLIFSIFATLPLAASAALTYSIPASTSTGSATITWSGGSSPGWTELWETSTAGSVKLTQTSVSGSYIVTKPAGTYYYYLRNCAVSPVPNPPPPNCTTTATSSIVFGGAPPAASIPSAPQSMTSKVAKGGVIASWPSSQQASYYKVNRNGAQVGMPDRTVFVDTGAVSGNTYGYSVAACNSAGCSGFTASNSVVAGAVQAGSSSTESYDYDALGRLTKVRAAGTPKTEYSYDKAGNRTAVTE